MNGHVSQTGSLAEPKTERTRVQERPNISVAEFAAIQRGYVERLGKLIEQLAAVMNRPDAPAAAVGSPAPAREMADVVHGVAHDSPGGKLTRTVLPDGSVSYGLGTDVVRSAVAKLLGAPRPAFVERGAATSSPYLEIVGTKDQEIAAAMAHAAKRWGNDEILIHAGGRHTAKIVEHAVAHGLNVANRDSYIQYLVARERDRQANPLTRRFQADGARKNIAVIERAPSAPQRSR